jgi:hypothetical protein
LTRGDGTACISDTTTGRPAGPQITLLPDGEMAVFDGATGT